MNLALRAKQVLDYATIGGAAALGLDDIVGSDHGGQEGRPRAGAQRRLADDVPVLNPEGHLVFQAGRGDVHTVLVNGQAVKYDHRLLATDRLEEARRLCAESIEHVRGVLGEEAWDAKHAPRAAGGGPDRQSVPVLGLRRRGPGGARGDLRFGRNDVRC